MPAARHLALLGFLFAAAAIGSGWRYHELGAQIEAGRDSLWQQLAVRPGDTVDASVHVSRAVEANEGRFDRLILLATARRLALVIGLGCALGALSTAAAVVRATARFRHQARRRWRSTLRPRGPKPTGMTR